MPGLANSMAEPGYTKDPAVAPLLFEFVMVSS